MWTILLYSYIQSFQNFQKRITFEFIHYDFTVPNTMYNINTANNMLIYTVSIPPGVYNSSSFLQAASIAPLKQRILASEYLRLTLEWRNYFVFCVSWFARSLDVLPNPKFNPSLNDNITEILDNCISHRIHCLESFRTKPNGI